MCLVEFLHFIIDHFFFNFDRLIINLIDSAFYFPSNQGIKTCNGDVRDVGV